MRQCMSCIAQDQSEQLLPPTSASLDELREYNCVLHTNANLLPLIHDVRPLERACASVGSHYHLLCFFPAPSLRCSSTGRYKHKCNRTDNKRVISPVFLMTLLTVRSGIRRVALQSAYPVPHSSRLPLLVTPMRLQGGVRYLSRPWRPSSFIFDRFWMD